MRLTFVFYAVLLGICSTFSGIGLSRFAYTPLLPALIDSGWFSTTEAVSLGAANLPGYLLGALLAHPLASRFGARPILHASLLLLSASFLLCAFALPVTLYALVRFLSGICGALLMVVGPSFALSQLPAGEKARLGPLIFTGIGLGILLSACGLPWLLRFGLFWSWQGLMLLSLLTWALVALALSKLSVQQAASTSHAKAELRGHKRWLISGLLIAYACDATGFVPHTLFWVDFLAREADFGIDHATTQWLIFGLGALIGPFIAAALSTRFSTQRALQSAYLIKALAIALPLMSLSIFSQSASSFWVGALTPGIVSLTSTRLAQWVAPQAHQKLWGLATALFALMQMLSGAGLALWYSQTLSYIPLFAFGSLCLILGALLIFSTQLCAAKETP